MAATSPLARSDNRNELVPLEGSLFRSEVVAEQQSQSLGTVLLVPKTSHATLAAFALLVAAGILSIMFFAHYTRTARVNGWLVPEQGIVQIFAPQAGVLAQLHVEEGQEVKKGTPLLLLSTELQSRALGETRKAVVQQLRSRRDSLVAERERASYESRRIRQRQYPSGSQWSRKS